MRGLNAYIVFGYAAIMVCSDKIGTGLSGRAGLCLRGMRPSHYLPVNCPLAVLRSIPFRFEDVRRTRQHLCDVVILSEAILGNTFRHIRNFSILGRHFC